MKKINILGYDYTLDVNKTTSELGGDIGFANFSNCQLSVAKDVPRQMQESTLIHEILEAVNYHLELDLTHPQIMGLEVAINQVLVTSGVDLSPLIKE